MDFTDSSADSCFSLGWEAQHAGNHDSIIRALYVLDTEQRVQAINAISDLGVRVRIARGVFGPKTAGDIGLVSTMDHPTTNYGEPHLGGLWDIDDK